MSLRDRALLALGKLLDEINARAGDGRQHEDLSRSFEAASDLIFDGESGQALAVIQSAFARAGGSTDA